MFSLIITIVAIALVVALVAATMYHGGDTLTQGRSTADASAFISGAQQIGGAAVMHLSLEGAPAADVAALLSKKYLATAPAVKGVSLAIDTTGAKPLVTAVVPSDDVCTAINKAAGVPEANQKTADATTFAALPYGCISATKTLQFKY